MLFEPILLQQQTAFIFQISTKRLTFCLFTLLIYNIGMNAVERGLSAADPNFLRTVPIEQLEVGIKWWDTMRNTGVALTVTGIGAMAATAYGSTEANSEILKGAALLAFFGEGILTVIQAGLVQDYVSSARNVVGEARDRGLNVINRFPTRRIEQTV